MVDDFLKDIKIGGRDSIFELGCGTGAALKRLRSIYGSNLKVHYKYIRCKNYTF